MTAPIIDVDAFDLPEWLGTEEVVWRADRAVRSGHLVPGRLTATDQDDLVCDLLAVDEAYPLPVTDDESRHRAHQAWHLGQVLVGTYGGRLTLAAPGTRWGSDRVLDALGRFAKAVGARPDLYSALMRIGG